jgi:uncharacterized SAM-binding protein YcdF (DUF218 family)
MLKKLAKWTFAGLCAAGALWFCLPALHGGFGEGSVFGVLVCGLGLALALLYPKAAARGGARRVLARVAAGLYGLGLVWALYLTGLIVLYQAAPPPPGRDVVVLGAQVYGPERMGQSLTGRVERAAAYLQENPEARCIVTGGQGGNEPCPEALTARNALVGMGIEPERIFMEDRSRNTRQNLAYAKEIADEQGFGPVVVVTQGFHMYRAVRLARWAGFEAEGLPAWTDPVIFPGYYGRELLSLTKWYVEELLGAVAG